MRHCTKETTYTMVRSAKILKRHSLSRLPAGSAEKRHFLINQYFQLFPEKVECPSPDTLIKKTAKVQPGLR